MERTVTMKVDGMSCGGCVAAVEKILTSVAGVERTRIDLQSGLARITVVDPAVTGDQLVMAVKMAGYNAGIVE